MKLRTALFVVLCMLGFSQLVEAKEGIKGNKNVVTREISISDYDRIEMVGGMEVVYEQSDVAPYFEIMVDENILPYLKIEVVGERLLVEPKSDRKIEIKPTTYKIKTNSKKLASGFFLGSGKFNLNNIKDSASLELELVGSGQVIVTNPAVGNFKMQVTGSGFMDVQKLSGNEIRGLLVGSGKIRINGTVTKGDLEVAGSGKIEAEKCVFKGVETRISGSGSIAVYATDSLQGEITGSGKIFYKGNPSINTNTVGSGKIKRID